MKHRNIETMCSTLRVARDELDRTMEEMDFISKSAGLVCSVNVKYWLMTLERVRDGMMSLCGGITKLDDEIEPPAKEKV